MKKLRYYVERINNCSYVELLHYRRDEKKCVSYPLPRPPPSSSSYTSPMVASIIPELIAPVVTELVTYVQISHPTCKMEKPVSQLTDLVHPRSLSGLD